jgi:hypothetical protein
MVRFSSFLNALMARLVSNPLFDRHLRLVVLSWMS